MAESDGKGLLMLTRCSPLPPPPALGYTPLRRMVEAGGIGEGGGRGNSCGGAAQVMDGSPHRNFCVVNETSV